MCCRRTAIVYSDHRHRANQLIEHHQYREAEMLDLTRRKPQTAFDVAQQIFADEERPIFHVMAATFETLAHLEHAYIEGRAKKTERDGRILFQAALVLWAILGGLLILNPSVFLSQFRRW